jgi:hypothetical protein
MNHENIENNEIPFNQFYENMENREILFDQFKSYLPDGPWQYEPHFFAFESFGFRCQLFRTPITFAWCGYVGIDKDHPYFEKDYDDLNDIETLDIHGGFTYSNRDKNNGLWWIGFDCAHSGDLIPTMRSTIGTDSPFSGHYWTLDEVRNETIGLAHQLKEAEQTAKNVSSS